jgi:hypothetical protein
MGIVPKIFALSKAPRLAPGPYTLVQQLPVQSALRVSR